MDKRHLAHQPLELQDLLGVGAGLQLRPAHARGVAIDDLHFVFGAQVVEQHVEQEAIELRFGQRIGAFELDRILRGQHEERLAERMRRAAHRHGMLLHGFEQRRLRLRRRAVDFVGQQDVGEQRAGHEGPAALAGGDVFFDDVGAGDVGGHQVGRELDALERQPERLRQRPHQQRLRGAGQAGDQAMAADEQRQQQLLDDFLLSDDDAADLRADRADAIAKGVHQRAVSCSVAATATSFIKFAPRSFAAAGLAQVCNAGAVSSASSRWRRLPAWSPSLSQGARHAIVRRRLVQRLEREQCAGTRAAHLRRDRRSASARRAARAVGVQRIGVVERQSALRSPARARPASSSQRASSRSAAGSQPPARR